MAEIPQNRSGDKIKSLHKASTSLIVVALVIGATGVGLGTYGVSSLLAGNPPAVAIINPGTGDVVAGSVTIRAMVSGGEGNDNLVAVLRNGTEIATSLPCAWDTTGIADGWYNITVIISSKHGTASDAVIVQVTNNPLLSHPILQVQQVINNTQFNHSKLVWEKFHTPITVNVSQGSRLFVQYSGVHWFNISSGDNRLTVAIYLNTTFLNWYNMRFQQHGYYVDYMMSTGTIEGLSEPLTAGTYSVLIWAEHDWLGSGGPGAYTQRSTLTVMELGG